MKLTYPVKVTDLGELLSVLTSEGLRTTHKVLTTNKDGLAAPFVSVVQGDGENELPVVLIDAGPYAYGMTFADWEAGAVTKAQRIHATIATLHEVGTPGPELDGIIDGLVKMLDTIEGGE